MSFEAYKIGLDDRSVILIKNVQFYERIERFIGVFIALTKHIFNEAC